MSIKQLFPLLLICVAVAATATDAAVTCNTVYTSLEPCLGFVLNGEPTVPSACCSGLKSLLVAAGTTDDRQSACKCIKSLASRANGVQIGRASQLPGICKVNVPYPISPNVDCLKIK
ncbi:hypothetical protein AABB24_034357 [Solanum stoloniferum]|uniref:Non-specific lipid-transfer protein n=1 Tax=Solanum stoloniferum TaxID=62892 RepID=A0ABD2RGB5_9SOLN